MFERTCKKCKKRKPIKAFYAQGKGGHMFHCKDCHVDQPKGKR
jgi:hypothetical protein